MDKPIRNVSVTGKIKFHDLKVTEPADYAAGFGGIKAALDHVRKEIGLIDSIMKLSKMNQEGGFDCPGCAWPDPDKRSSLGEFCENGVKALVEEATTNRVDRSFFSKYSVEEISQWSDYEIGKSGRITEPVVLRPGSLYYEPISWSDAFALIGNSLKLLDHPDEAIFYTSGRSSNEAAYLYGLFARAFGTNNLPDCSNMCHESSGVALKETLGIGKGSVKLDDFEKAEVVLVIGQNPGTNHPRMLSALQKCKNNGGKIVSINPLREAGLVRFKNPQQISGYLTSGTEISDIHLQVRVNEDVALLKLILKKLKKLDESTNVVFDWDFIKDKTIGHEVFFQDLENYQAEDLLERCGVSESAVDQVVTLLAGNSKIIICWAMGLTQHENAVDNVKECVNLLLLKGSIGKAGAGTCPVRGHSNVQGDRTVGISHHVDAKLIEALKSRYEFEPPLKVGLDTIGAIRAMHEGIAKVFIALGGNFLSAASDTHYTAKALQNCALTVSISTKLNRTHLFGGSTSLILPTLGRSEMDEHDGQQRFITVENSMGIVHQSKGAFKPASQQLKSEPEIVAEIAHSYFQGKGSIDWLAFGDDYDLIRNEIQEVVPGFAAVKSRDLRKGFGLPNNARQGDFSGLPKGKAEFSICKLSSIQLESGEFLLTTIRSHDQFNTTIYGLDDRYRGVFNERRVVLMNAQDIAEFDFHVGEVVDLESNYDDVIRKAESFKIVSYDIPRKNLAAYFPETNVLIPIDQYARSSRTPISKSVKVRIRKSKLSD